MAGYALARTTAETYLLGTAHRLPPPTGIPSRDAKYAREIDRAPESAVFTLLGDGLLLPYTFDVRVPLFKRTEHAARVEATPILAAAQTTIALCRYDETAVITPLNGEFRTGIMGLQGYQISPVETNFSGAWTLILTFFAQHDGWFTDATFTGTKYPF